MTRFLLTAALATGLAASSHATLWAPVQSTDQLSDGTRCMIVYNQGDNSFVMSDVMTSNYRGVVEMPYSVSFDAVPEGAAIVELQAMSEGRYALYVTNGDTGYINPLDGKNGLATSDMKSSAEITVTDGEATIIVNNPDDPDRQFFTYWNQQTFTGWVKKFVIINDAVESSGYLALYTEQNDGPVTPKVTWTADPAPGMYVDELQQFSITFDGATGTELNYDAEMDWIKATVNGETTTSPNSGYYGNPVWFSYRNPITTPGEYCLHLDAGLLNITYPDGSVVPSPEINYTLNIIGQTPGLDINWTTIPASGETVSRLVDIVVEFTNTLSAELNPDAEPITAWLGYEMLTAPTPLDEAPLVLQFATPVTQNGDYEVIIPEGFWNLTTDEDTVQPSPEVYFEITVDDGVGVAKLMDNTTADVFTPSGVCVARNASAAQIKALPAGIYLSQGRKFVVR